MYLSKNIKITFLKSNLVSYYDRASGCCICEIVNALGWLLICFRFLDSVMKIKPFVMSRFAPVKFCVCVCLFRTESLFVFPCQWNYRPDHCIYGSNCHQAEKEGIFILHGNRGVYHDDKQPAFRAVYEAIKYVSICSFISILILTSLFDF